MLEKENKKIEKTLIVGIITQNQDEDKLNEYLDELAFLTYTAAVSYTHLRAHETN
jgi:GTP-binding protein HflX